MAKLVTTKTVEVFEPKIQLESQLAQYEEIVAKIKAKLALFK